MLRQRKKEVKMFQVLLLLISVSFSLDLVPYAKILKSVVEEKEYSLDGDKFTQSHVDYKKLKESSALQKLLNQQIQLFAKANPPIEKQAKLSFWINAYNFFTLVDVQTHFPISSMKQIGWKQKNHIVNGKKLSLDKIEHSLIRPLGDAKIHFAINCASVGCPSLKPEPYTPQNLQSELVASVTNSLKNPMHLRPYEGWFFSSKGVSATKIFSWFRKDFKSIEAFVNKFGPKSLIKKKVYTNIDYDWRLNTKENVLEAFAKLKGKLTNLR